MTKKSARFVTGSIWRHVIIMTLTNSIGLMALFLVDLIDLYFLNLLGEQEMAAAVGFSAQLMFYVTALSIGLLIATGILVSQRMGSQNILAARHIATNALILAVLLILLISAALLCFLNEILVLLGAKGNTLKLATTYSSIILPSSILMTIGMIASGILRAIGDAKRSMQATLLGAAINLIFDPLFIFLFSMGIAGAAWASVLSRFAMASYALYCIIKLHGMAARPRYRKFLEDLRPIIYLACPAILTNLATPIGSTFVMTSIAFYGDAAVAAYATIGRIIPVAFSTLFALSGAISPIIGQNFGAKQFHRIQEIYKDAIIFSIGMVCLVTIGIMVAKPHLVAMFNLSNEAADLLTLFCSGLTLFFIADGILFSTNSAFNSLGFPFYSTFFNYAKFFLGVIPTVYVLSHFYGAKGVIIGQATGSILVSLVAVITCKHVMNRVSDAKHTLERVSLHRKWLSKFPLWPTSSSKIQR